MIAHIFLLCGEASDAMEEIGRMNWFRKQVEVMTLLACRVEQVRSTGLTGKEQDFAFGALSFDLNRKINPRQLRHHYVRDQQIGGFETSAVKGFQGIRERRCREAASFQNRGESRCDDLLIVDDEDARNLLI
jgi:hypothetical protein